MLPLLLVAFATSALAYDDYWTEYNADLPSGLVSLPNFRLSVSANTMRYRRVQHTKSVIYRTRAGMTVIGLVFRKIMEASLLEGLTPMILLPTGMCIIPPSHGAHILTCF